MNLNEFFDMGGKALYVWGSYGITAIVLTGIVIAAWRSEKVIRRRLAQQMKREERGLK